MKLQSLYNTWIMQAVIIVSFFLSCCRKVVCFNACSVALSVIPQADSRDGREHFVHVASPFLSPTFSATHSL